MAYHIKFLSLLLPYRGNASPNKTIRQVYALRMYIYIYVQFPRNLFFAKITRSDSQYKTDDNNMLIVDFDRVNLFSLINNITCRVLDANGGMAYYRSLSFQDV